MKKINLILIFLFLLTKIFSQLIHYPLSNVGGFYFSRNDSIFRANITFKDPEETEKSSLKIAFIQSQLSPKYNKNICNYAKFRKRIFKSKNYKKYHEMVGADYECVHTGIYITYSCDKKKKIIRFFGMEYIKPLKY